MMPFELLLMSFFLIESGEDEIQNACSTGLMQTVSNKAQEKPNTHPEQISYKFADTHADTKIRNTFALNLTHFNPHELSILLKTILKYKLMIDSVLNIFLRNN